MQEFELYHLLLPSVVGQRPGWLLEEDISISLRSARYLVWTYLLPQQASVVVLLAVRLAVLLVPLDDRVCKHLLRC